MKCSNLDVWKEAVELSSAVYLYFKDCRDYGFKDQITRSGLSIPSNIAEGMEKGSSKEQVRFLDIAKGSAAEFVTQVHIGLNIDYIEENAGKEWIARATHILSMLTKLQDYLRSKS